jgi:hypothetical protein
LPRTQSLKKDTSVAASRNRAISAAGRVIVQSTCRFGQIQEEARGRAHVRRGVARNRRRYEHGQARKEHALRAAYDTLHRKTLPLPVKAISPKMSSEQENRFYADL